MLRHACGFKLTNEGHDTRAIQDYLGHRNIPHAVTYTELAANRFRALCRLRSRRAKTSSVDTHCRITSAPPSM